MDFWLFKCGESGAGEDNKICVGQESIFLANAMYKHALITDSLICWKIFKYGYYVGFIKDIYGKCIK